MKKGLAAAVVAAACLAAGCSSESEEPAAAETPAAPETTYTPPPSKSEMEELRTEIGAMIAPCAEVATMLTTECTKAAFYSVQELEELQGRLTSDFPQTRVAVAELISDLEYWKDNCVTSKANSPERQACIRYMIVPAEFDNVVFAYYEDLDS